MCVGVTVVMTMLLEENRKLSLKLHRDVSSLLKVTLLGTAIGVVSNASEFEAVVNYVPPPPRALHSAAVRQEEGSNFDIEDTSCI